MILKHSSFSFDQGKGQSFHVIFDEGKKPITASLYINSEYVGRYTIQGIKAGSRITANKIYADYISK